MRIKELGALRGLASLLVLFFHLLIVFPLFDADTSQAGLTWLNICKYTPLHLLWDGSGAVRIFFILSGFVLALPYVGGHAPTYPAFLIKRFCRIYLPYVVALSISALLDTMLSGKHPLSGLGSLPNQHWQHPLTAKILLDHIILIGNFQHAEINGVFWTLTHEMRISLIFPLLIALARHWTGKRFFFMLYLISILGYLWSAFANQRLGLNTDYFQSLSFLWLFAIGILLAQRRVILITWYQQLAPHERFIYALLAIICFSYRYLVPGTLLAHNDFVDDAFNAIGAVYLIIVALAAPSVQTWLSRPVCLSLGDISYSLYLYHVPLLLGWIWLLYGSVPMGGILVIASSSTFIVALVMQRLIEAPAQALGHRLAMSRRRHRYPTRAARSSI